MTQQNFNVSSRSRLDLFIAYQNRSLYTDSSILYSDYK